VLPSREHGQHNLIFNDTGTLLVATVLYSARGARMGAIVAGVDASSLTLHQTSPRSPPILAAYRAE